MDFLAENNACGQTLLRLVAKGNATVAELLRLKDVIPAVYGKSPSKADAAKYGELIQADFNYFKSTEQFENRVAIQLTFSRPPKVRRLPNFGRLPKSSQALTS